MTEEEMKRREKAHQAYLEMMEVFHRHCKENNFSAIEVMTIMSVFMVSVLGALDTLTEAFRVLADSMSVVSLRLTEHYAKRAKQRKQEEP